MNSILACLDTRIRSWNCVNEMRTINLECARATQDTAVVSKEKDWKRRIEMYGELLGTFAFVSPFIR
jgi:hypothetical protein